MTLPDIFNRNTALHLLLLIAMSTSPALPIELTLVERSGIDRIDEHEGDGVEEVKTLVR